MIYLPSGNSCNPLAYGETGVKERVRGVLNYKKPAFWVIIVAVITCIVVAVCFMTNPTKRITLPDDPVVFSIHDNPDGYIEYHWEEKGLVYVPYMPLDPGLAGDCIGYDELEGELESYVCKVKGLSETEWICDVLSDKVNGHTAGMIMREINVKKVPEGWESEYAWNISYTDYVGDAPTVTEIARRLPYPDEYQYDHIEIQMYVKDVTPTGCTLVFSQTGGDVTGELQTGRWFEIQVKNANGEWSDNSSKDIEISWEDIAYLISSNGTTELDLNWEYVYGYLGDGHYRIVKKVMDYRSPGVYDEYEVYAEFDIGNGTTSTESVTDWMDITLSTKEFTQDEAEEIARTVSIK